MAGHRNRIRRACRTVGARKETFDYLDIAHEIANQGIKQIPTSGRIIIEMKINDELEVAVPRKGNHRVKYRLKRDGRAPNTIDNTMRNTKPELRKRAKQNEPKNKNPGT